MEKKEIKELRKSYKRAIGRRKRRYCDTAEYKISMMVDVYSMDTEEAVMDLLLRLKEINNDYNIYINNGLFYENDGKKTLIDISEIDKEPLSSEKNIMSKLENRFYNLESGKEEHASKANNDIIITLPSLTERIENNSTDYDARRDNKILRAQFFLKLINGKVDDVINYYADPKNWKEIDNKLTEYKEKVKVR